MPFTSFGSSITSKPLCRVLNVNRSTYYKHFTQIIAPRKKDNQKFKRIILNIYADFNKCLGAYKLTHILCRDYGISISVGRFDKNINVYYNLSIFNLFNKN